MPITDPTAEALSALRRADAPAADLAETALEGLTWGDGLGSVTHQQLQTWLWYVLPVKYLTDVDEKLALAGALGRLFECAGMPDYAAVCHSGTTRHLIELYEQDDAAARTAFRKAAEDSGVEPVDVPELAWGAVMGSVEAQAHAEASIALELALRVGDVRPGARGWRTAQRVVVRAFLLRPHPEFAGACPLDAILAERVKNWALTGGTARRALLRDLSATLLGSHELPAPALSRTVAPVRALLARAADGLTLTPTHRLRPATVTSLVEEFGWDVIGRRRWEEDVVEVVALRALATRAGLLRRSGLSLVLTPLGRQVASDDSALWRELCRTLVTESGFTAAAEEAYLAALLQGQGEDTAVDTATTAVSAGWHVRGGTEGPSRSTVAATVWELRAALGVLGMWNRPGRRRYLDDCTLTDSGRAAARAALAARATRPQEAPWG